MRLSFACTSRHRQAIPPKDPSGRASTAEREALRRRLGLAVLATLASRRACWIGLVDVTPRPLVAEFDGSDDGMAGRVGSACERGGRRSYHSNRPLRR